jgi:hypothetical protein
MHWAGPMEMTREVLNDLVAAAARGTARYAGVVVAAFTGADAAVQSWVSPVRTTRHQARGRSSKSGRSPRYSPPLPWPTLWFAASFPWTLRSVRTCLPLRMTVGLQRSHWGTWRRTPPGCRVFPAACAGRRCASGPTPTGNSGPRTCSPRWPSRSSAPRRGGR